MRQWRLTVLAALFVLSGLGAAFPAIGTAQEPDATEQVDVADAIVQTQQTNVFSANGCTVIPKKPVNNEGTLEASVELKCTTERDGRELIIELWQLDNDGNWKSVPETDLRLMVPTRVDTPPIGPDNISCRDLDAGRTRLYRTRATIQIGGEVVESGFSDVEEIGRDCLEGMDEAHLKEVGLSAGSEERRRRPPRGAEKQDMTVKCRDLRGEPRLERKAGCDRDGRTAAAAAAQLGDCGYAWISVVNLGGGLAEFIYGWRSSLGPMDVVSTDVGYENKTTNRSETWNKLWTAKVTFDDLIYDSDSSSSTRYTDAGRVVGFHYGDGTLAIPPLVTCKISRGEDEARVD